MKYKILFLLACLLPVVISAGCRHDENPEGTEGSSTWKDLVPVTIQWDGTRHADITYQILVYSFADSDGDGIGDFNGITSRLDYLDMLGVSAVWLSPVHPSISYHGYDVKDYFSVNPDFGTMDDFRNLLEQAHNHGIKVYLDYVVNHSSTQTEWFVDALASADSPYRNFYSFSTDPQKDIAEGRIAQIATEGSRGYLQNEWRTQNGIFWHAQFKSDRYADFNYGKASEAEHSDAFNAVCKSAEQWLELGVDGFRLDAVKHIYHDTKSSENPEFLEAFYNRLNAFYKSLGNKDNLYMVGEALSKAPLVAQYYSGLPAMFEFSFWYTLKSAIQSNTGNLFLKDLQAFRELYVPYRQDFIAATKLSNHDENRAASELDNDKAKLKLAAAVLMTASGSPYIYQGEELGYWGKTSSGDEYVRTPMMWDRTGRVADRYLNGKTDVSMLKPQISVEAQSEDENSILEVYRDFTLLRNAYPALACGEMTAHPKYNEAEGQKEAAVWYMGRNGRKEMLVIHNFSPKNLIFTPGDNLANPVAISGNARIDNEQGKLMVNAWSSIVFEL